MNAFKRFSLALAALTLAASPLMAGERMIMGGMGSASGTYDYQDTDSSGYFSNTGFDHDLTGSSFSVAYVAVKDSGLMWGAGYHSFTLSGGPSTQTVSSPPLDYTFTVSTDSFSVSGFFALIGYQMKFADQFKFMPNLRLGLGNRHSATQTVDTTVTLGTLSASGSDSYSHNVSGSPMMISLPLYFQLTEKLALGLEIVSSGSGLEITEGTSTETYILGGATQLSLTYGF